MKHLFVTLLFVGGYLFSHAQTQILDANTSFAGSTAQSTIYVSDTSTISAVHIQIGNAPGTFSFNDSIPVTNSSIVMHSNEVDISLTSVPTLSTYYIRYSVILNDNSIKTIDLNK